MKIPIFPGKYHQHGGFSMAMLVYWRVSRYLFSPPRLQRYLPHFSEMIQLLPHFSGEIMRGVLKSFQKTPTGDLPSLKLSSQVST